MTPLWLLPAHCGKGRSSKVSVLTWRNDARREKHKMEKRWKRAREKGKILLDWTSNTWYVYKTKVGKLPRAHQSVCTSGFNCEFGPVWGKTQISGPFEQKSTCRKSIFTCPFKSETINSPFSYHADDTTRVSCHGIPAAFSKGITWHFTCPKAIKQSLKSSPAHVWHLLAFDK